MRRTCAWGVLERDFVLLDGGVEKGRGCSRNALEVDVDARKGERACTIQADEAAEKTMSRHGDDECPQQENCEVHLEKVAVKLSRPYVA